MMPSVLSILSVLLLIAAAADVDVVNQTEAAKLLPKDAPVQKLAGGLQFVEGPVWVTERGGGYLIFSDIPANEPEALGRRPWGGRNECGEKLTNRRIYEMTN